MNKYRRKISKIEKGTAQTRISFHDSFQTSSRRVLGDILSYLVACRIMVFLFAPCWFNQKEKPSDRSCLTPEGQTRSSFQSDRIGAEEGGGWRRRRRKKWKEATLCPYTVRGTVSTHRWKALGDSWHNPPAPRRTLTRVLHQESTKVTPMEDHPDSVPLSAHRPLSCRLSSPDFSAQTHTRSSRRRGAARPSELGPLASFFRS